VSDEVWPHRNDFRCGIFVVPDSGLALMPAFFYASFVFFGRAVFCELQLMLEWKTDFGSLWEVCMRKRKKKNKVYVVAVEVRRRSRNFFPPGRHRSRVFVDARRKDPKYPLRWDDD
jgi:hypothetical protein